MPMTSTSLLVVIIIIIVLLISTPPSHAEIHSTTLRSDGRPIIPLDEFGFTHTGALDLNASSISISEPSPELDLSRVGFLLSTRDAWPHVLQQLLDSDISCPLNSNLITQVFTLNRLDLSHSQSFSFTLNLSRPGRFTLLFSNCLSPDLRVSMHLTSSLYNLDPRSRTRSYISVGSTLLPSIYFFLCLVYVALSFVWIAVLIKKRHSAFRIHFFMLALLGLKALNLLCEAEDLSYTDRTGTAHGWDVLFYIFSFLKGITLFTLIVLIGTGWSFLKPYLQDKEKKVLMVVIPLQVVANIAQIGLDETGPYDRGSITWSQIFLLVDMVCCCSVLFPIVWSIKNLREAARTDGKAAVNLMKLMLFRQYYVTVICYIYFTRVIVYALVTITSYRYLWTSVAMGEIATLAFYVFTGYKFRPEVHNPYFVIDEAEEEAALEAMKMDDEFEL